MSSVKFEFPRDGLGEDIKERFPASEKLSPRLNSPTLSKSRKISYKAEANNMKRTSGEKNKIEYGKDIKSNAKTWPGRLRTMALFSYDLANEDFRIMLGFGFIEVFNSSRTSAIVLSQLKIIQLRNVFIG